MTSITTCYAIDLMATNDNSEDVYFMRMLCVPFHKAQYVPVRCCDVMPDNFLRVEI